ncbi:MAG: pyridoxal-phosphate dependent enzyme [Mucilaginibacter polytrichastri]|nr:pyridoxal-phosphate dependent enzyme [Mucilaginibacter polytrichastri]
MDLLRLPSPVHELISPSFFSHDDEVWIKRDDLIHPLVSGNKSRKLRFLLDDARGKGKTHLVSFGGAFSNHLLALAAAAAEQGFRATGFVRGDAVDNEMLFLCRMMGMELIFIRREEYRDKRAVFTRYFSTDDAAYFIDEGGAGTLGARGCEAIIEETEAFFTHIFCACGTGTTAAGMINAAAKRSPDTRVHVVPVLRHAAMETGIRRMLHADLPFELHCGYEHGGYARSSPELLAFIQTFSAETGILIDPVYTGKLLFAVHDLLRSKRLSPGKILVVHTGGMFGLLGMRDRFPPPGSK